MSKETREQKAQRLVDTGCILGLYVAVRGAMAKVQGDHGTYICTILDSGYYNCSCKYGQTHPNTQDRCSHALATALAAERTQV